MKILMLRTLALFPMLAVFGCSSSDSPPGTNTAELTGSVNGVSLKARSAVARWGNIGTSTVNGTTTSVRGLTILISDKPNTCKAFHIKDSTNLSVKVDAELGSHPITSPMPDPASAVHCEVDFKTVDGSCHQTVAESATSGKVDIFNVATTLFGPGASIVSGSIDAKFEAGHMTGDFDAILCPEPRKGDVDPLEAADCKL